MLRKKKHKLYKPNQDVVEQPKAQPIEKVEPLNKPKLSFVIKDDELETLTNAGFLKEWVHSLANRYNFTKIEYHDKFKGFKCFTNGRCIDTITVNDLSSLNGGSRITDKGMAFRRLDKNKQTIKLAWRN